MKALSFISVFFLIIIFTSSCQMDESNGTGKLVLSVTDSPVDAVDVKAVYVTFTGLEYQNNGGAWETASTFVGPRTINLLGLQNGKTSLLGDFNLTSGNYTGLRFKLDAPTRGANVPSNPGCYIEMVNGDKKPLFVPSGGQTGYKAIGSFTVPINGLVEVTADFDLRKSVVSTGGNATYLLKPTIKITVNNQAGEIKGTISNLLSSKKYIIYAYSKDLYNSSEAATPSGENVRFPNAISSSKIDLTGIYTLSFLAAGTYDLIIASTDAAGNVLVEKQIKGVIVESKKTTTQNGGL
jgi:hypothetical protein